MESTTLYYREGSSDKVYQVAIEPSGDKFVVNFAYGRRGSTLQTGTKTSSPTEFAAAKIVYDKLVKEKTAKGYTPGENGTRYQHTENESRASGIACQLLNPIERDEVQAFINDPAYCMQEKYDGRRLLIRKTGDVVHGINRLGLIVGIPASIHAAAEAIPGDFIIDGEAIDGELFAFDLLSIRDRDMRTAPYGARHLALLNLLASGHQRFIRFVLGANRLEDKRKLFDQLVEQNKEGVVFKRLDAPYTPGRPNSGGSQVKFKFYETASFVVSRINGKRSVALMVFDGEKVVPVGNVTIPPNHAVPALGAVVEVRYLYAFRNGSIFQPVYLGPREDIGQEECIITQLKYKAEAKAA